ncbi:MAG: hypothetical protein D3910_23375 [Candidatus Electrothrix sp. ATG2]|nr:hypothetical protein [Candidatus Electrothrix sp. ATG2]
MWIRSFFYRYFSQEPFRPLPQCPKESFCYHRFYSLRRKKGRNSKVAYTILQVFLSHRRKNIDSQVHSYPTSPHFTPKKLSFFLL